MVDEKEDSYEPHEEGEYHFSDDQVNYDIEGDSSKVAAPAASLGKGNVLVKLAQSRRLAVGIVAFIFLIFIVYKMFTSSSSTTPETDFSPAQTTVANATMTTKPKVTTTTTTTQTAPTTVQTPAAAPMQPGMPSSVAQQQAVMPQQTTAPSVQIAPQQQGMPTATPQQAMQSAPQSPPVQIIQNQPMNHAPPTAQDSVMQTLPTDLGSAPPTEIDSAQTKMIMDRLAVLEEQNAKLVALLENQVAQRVSDAQMQNMATQQKVRTLTKRLGNMEGSINKIAQIMQDEGFSKAMPLAVGNSGMPSSKTSMPKTLYTVQAIIPGRAWLKSDAGDTVTVAEGDLLKDYGRIAKIDPYDGVVEIDTGTKTITLSYGIGGD